MQIVVLDGYTLNPGDNPWDAVATLGELTVYDRTPMDHIVDRVGRAEIVLTNKTPLDGPILAALPSLRFVSVLATGYNVVDVACARRQGITVSNVPEYGTDSVAQYVIALLLTLVHRPERHDRLVQRGEWQRHGDFCFWDAPLVELAGKRMGIVGFGRIGRKVGELAHALGMDVLACDICPGSEPHYQPFAWRSIEAMFAEADVVSLHCPLDEHSQGMVNRERIGTMKRSTLLINTARGGLVQERDLADALNDGRIAGAAVDVLSQEPPVENNPLVGAKNCLVTPHLAWATQEARRRLMAITAANIAAFLRGEPINVVN
ncbi:MAG: D-2-hydroxyacid dehydrogenase [Thermoguttaceae bacterium]